MLQLVSVPLSLAQWLLSDTSSPHWLCSRAPDLRRDSAVFLLRLVCYKSRGDVEHFKKGLDHCLLSCCDCAEAYFDHKATLMTRFVDGQRAS